MQLNQEQTITELISLERADGLSRLKTANCLPVSGIQL